MLSADSDWDFLFQYGITGDLCNELVATSRALFDSDPESIYAYATWKACLELASRFMDEQGIPVDEAETIDTVVIAPLRAFVVASGLFIENDRTRSLLSGLLRALWELRIALSLLT